MNTDSSQDKPSLAGVPVYPDVKLYANILMGMRVWEADGWKPETMSWKTGCYIHSGLSGPMETTFRGPDAQRFLSSISINDCYQWPIGTSKHLVFCDEHGLVASHKLTTRDSETTFRSFAGMGWAFYLATQSNMDVEASVRQIFIHQVAGPTSLQVLERVTGESLRDVKFLGFRRTQVPGIDAEIEVARIGMAGTLAYELRGPLEFGPAVYDAVYQAGRDLGIKRLGWKSYVVNHTEGGFPQMGCTFLPMCFGNQGFINAIMGGQTPATESLSGSVDPADFRARLRTPVEVGWGWMAKFNHDFLGRQALEAEVDNPKRTIVMLRWNPEDVIDIFASLFRPGEEYKTFELPCTPTSPAGGHADHVTKDSRPVGISSLAVYSYYYREMISQCTIDCDQAQIGNEVVIHWGDYGKHIKPVRATVARFPYLDLPRNQYYDLSTVPSGLANR